MASTGSNTLYLVPPRTRRFSSLDANSFLLTATAQSLSCPMNSAFPVLPIEITDLIIDSIGRNVDRRDARVALQACSLVCRSFRKKSQHYLFSKIVLRKTQFDSISTTCARITALRAFSRFPFTTLRHHGQPGDGLSRQEHPNGHDDPRQRL